MALPALAAATAGQQVIRVMDKPIIGWSQTKTRKNKTTTRNFEINGWHLAAGVGTIATFVGLGIATGVLRWNKHEIKDKDGKVVNAFYFPAANPDAVDGGNGWIRKAAAGSAPNYILGGGPLGALISLFWGKPP